MNDFWSTFCKSRIILKPLENPQSNVTMHSIGEPNAPLKKRLHLRLLFQTYYSQVFQKSPIQL